MGKNITGSKPFWRNPENNSQSQTQDSDHTEYWHSRLEFEVYCELRLWFHPEEIIRQHRVRIKPDCSNFEARYWNIDFMLSWRSKGGFAQQRLIEVKGEWIFQQKSELALLRCQIEMMSIFSPLSYGVLSVVGTKQRILHKPLRILEYKSVIHELAKIKTRDQS